MSQILVCASPAPGHVNPMLTIASSLAELGNNVTFTTSDVSSHESKPQFVLMNSSQTRCGRCESGQEARRRLGFHQVALEHLDGLFGYALSLTHNPAEASALYVMVTLQPAQ